MKQSSFDAMISALDAETSSLDAGTSALGAETSEIARSYRRYQRGVSDDIGDYGVGITPQMSNRVTNHGDMSTFSKPACNPVHCVHKIDLNIQKMTNHPTSHKTFNYLINNVTSHKISNLRCSKGDVTLAA